MFNDGDSVYPTCLAKGGPGNIFQWSFNESVLQIGRSNVLILSTITAVDNGGLYICTVTNDAGSDYDDTFVNLYPMITVNPNDLFVSAYDDAVFSCEATAFPTPTYEWFSDAGYFPFGINGQFTSTLHINAYYYNRFFSQEDFYCTATSNNVTVESERATLYGMWSKILFIATYVSHNVPFLQLLLMVYIFNIIMIYMRMEIQ